MRIGLPVLRIAGQEQAVLLLKEKPYHGVPKGNKPFPYHLVKPNM